MTRKYQKLVQRVRVVADDGRRDEATVHQDFIVVEPLSGPVEHLGGLKRYTLVSSGHHLNPTPDPDVFEDPHNSDRWRIVP
jgi:hypothetical protein